MSQARVGLLGIGVDRLDITAVGERLERFIESGVPHYVLAANLDYLRLCIQGPSLRELANSADLVVPDGMPLVWASRLRGVPLPRRIAGVDLMCEAARLAAERGHRIFLLGDILE